MDYDHDLLMCITPHYDIIIPVAAPFILNGVVKKNGFKSKVIDFNMELSYNYRTVFENSVKMWRHVDLLFKEDPLKFPEFKKLIDKWSNDILTHRARYVGFSILTQFNYLCVIELAKKLKGSGTKVIVGGVSALWFKEYLEENDLLDLMDHIVIGYGENIIVEILKGNVEDKIINSPTLDFSINYIADYSDIDLLKYRENRLYLSTSRGCIYHCSFCQVKHIWNKFVQRPVDHVLEEMLYMKEHYNIDSFKLTDSLINAGLPHLRSLCNTLKDYKFKWDAMFSIRRLMKENDYRLLSEAGCKLVHIGVESGSLSVREHMGKTFTDEDVFETLDNLEKYNIETCLMFMTGYPTETETDLFLTKELITKIKQRDYSVVTLVRVVPLSIDVPELQKYKEHPNYIKRIERYKTIRDHIIESGFVVQQDSRLKKWYNV